MTARSRFAFECSVKLLFSGAGRGVALWTLTFPVRKTDWLEVSLRWARFRRRVNRLFPGGFPGVRVVEWHPGGHGWHLHYLTSAYARVEAVRASAQACGFGRVNVLWLGRREGAMAAYLAKHFRKDFYLSSSKAHGQRKWACMGGFKGTSVRNIQVESSYWAWLRLRSGGQRLKAKERALLRREWLVGPPLAPWQKPASLSYPAPVADVPF